jgi:Delta7-sterol 5-desaturase
MRQFVTQNAPLSYWLIALVVVSFGYALLTEFFRARKIQPNGFRWKTFRNELLFATFNLAIGATVLAYVSSTLTAKGIITFNKAPTGWWVMALEYAAYFLGFDTWFYWFHRLMHTEPIYTWVHKMHHRSTSPNLLTTVSETPWESWVNGGFLVVFTSLFTVHASTMTFIGPTSIIMGLYVHSGFEFFPRWWNRSWASKWFITATFHDQHHRYFKWNFGGYTTIWDWICATVRPNFVADFEQIRARIGKPLPSVVAVQGNSPSA